MTELDVEFKIKSLLDALRIYSPSGQERDFAIYLRDLFRGFGVNAWIDNVGNVIAIKGHGEPVLWLHAHMDTTPGFIEVKIEDGKAYGRGASDDKGPLMAMAMAFIESEVENGTLVFTGVVREETDSLGTMTLMNADYVPRPTGVIVGEPTGIDRLVLRYRGGGKIDVKIKTKGGHSANPFFEENAILIAFDIYERLCRALGVGSRYEDFLLTPTIVKCGIAENVIPSDCKLVLDVRIPPGKSCVDVEKAVKEVAMSYQGKAEVKLRDCVNPIEIRPDNPVARAVTRAISIVLRVRPRLARKWGTCDANLLALITDEIVVYGPGESENTHSTEECIKINDYLKGIEVYKEAIRQYFQLKSQGSAVGH